MSLLVTVAIVVTSMASEAVANEVNASEENDEGTLCTDLANDQVTESCKFWIQGIGLTLIGVAGVVGNSVSVFVLTRPSMLSVFNLILAVMTSFDTLYLVASVAEFSFVETFHLTSEGYDQFFVYFLYPLHNVALCCSIFLHVVLAFERYLAVCHPQLVYSATAKRRGNNQISNNQGHQSHHSPNAAIIYKKVLIYVVPVVLSSVLLNVPRWFELELKEMLVDSQGGLVHIKPDTNVSSQDILVKVVAGTGLRYNKYYVTYYLHWTLLLLTGILPLAALAFFNTRIYRRLKEVRKIRTHTNKNDPNYAATLASIIVIFFVCHMPRIVKNVSEIVVTNQLIATGTSCSGVNPAKCLVHFNNFILVINASSGFFVYCFIGTFGVKFVEVLTSCCRRQDRNDTPEENPLVRIQKSTQRPVETKVTITPRGGSVVETSPKMDPSPSQSLCSQDSTS